MNVTPPAFRTDRAVVLDWAERGAIPKARLVEALAVTGITPGAPQWRVFLDRFLLWCGAAFLGAGAIFFIASNWTGLGRFQKFGLVEAAIVAAVLAAWALGIDRVAGKAALLVASLATGGLLAFFGQTYQTGADTWELFSTWGALVLPWILVARFVPLWVLWIAIVNLGIALYFRSSPFLLGIAMDPERQAWALFVFNTLALGVWELLAQRMEWLDERWAVRLLAMAGGTAITGLAVVAIADWSGQGLTMLSYLAWLVIIHLVYRRIIFDLFMIAGTFLSVIVTVTAFLSIHLFESSGGFEAGFLLTALAVIGMTAGAAAWLRTIGSEQP
jgi:uncharacterized membrane protein